MEMTPMQRRLKLMSLALGFAYAPHIDAATDAADEMVDFVDGLMQEGENKRKRLAEWCESLAATYNKASEERHALRAERDDLRSRLADAEHDRDRWMADYHSLEDENTDLRNRLELVEVACTAHRVTRTDPTDEKLLARAAQILEEIDELARAKVSTAGHGDLHDACAPGWLGAAREGGPLL